MLRSICMWELLTWQVPWGEYGPWQVVAMVTESAARPEVRAHPIPPHAPPCTPLPLHPTPSAGMR